MTRKHIADGHPVSSATTEFAANYNSLFFAIRHVAKIGLNTFLRTVPYRIMGRTTVDEAEFSRTASDIPGTATP